jgi:hypothetical protein
MGKSSLDPTPPAESSTTRWVILNANETPHKALEGWKKLYPNFSYVGASPRGCGPIRWSQKNPPNTIERSLALLGQTADSGRVRDVAAFLSSGRPDGMKLRLAGRGQAGVIAAYAALLCPGTVQELVILDPPTSHRDGPFFLNVDRVLDLPTALGLLAPGVKLILVNAKDKAFDRIAEIYDLAGAEEKFRRY